MEKKQKPSRGKVVKQWLPGYAQGLVRVIICYPFESLKVNLQMGVYKTMSAAVCDIVTRNPRLLYKASLLSFLVTPIDRSCQYLVLEKHNNMGYNPYMVGLCIGASSSLYSIPLQYITSNALYAKSTNFIRKRTIKELYRGASIEFPRVSIATSVYCGTYISIRNKMMDSTIMSTVLTAPLIGVFSCITSWLAVFPLDTLRTEMQVTSSGGANGAKIIIDIVKKRYRTGGIASFYKGITPIIIRTIPSSAVGMLTYEYFRKLCC